MSTIVIESSRRQLPRAFLLICVAVCLGWLTASAHARLEHSDPPAGAVIPAAPAEVHIWFTQELFRREGANTMEVYGPDGEQVDNLDARIDDDDRTHMLVSLAADLPPEVYTVRYETLSADDGDSDSGEFSFTVDADAAPSTTEPAPTSAPTVTTVTPILEEPTEAPTAAPQTAGGLPCTGGALVGFLALGLTYGRQRYRPGRS